jgi:membrane AbrB-like protein
MSGAMGNKTVAWIKLFLLTSVLVVPLELLNIPAAPLLGAILAAVITALRGTAIQIPAKAFAGAQSLVGCSIAASISLPVLQGMADHLALALTAVFSIVLFNYILGWIVTIKQILPGTTGIWGTSPGAATPMTLMCEFYGADIRIVAFMQYLRIIAVAGLAAIFSKISGISKYIEQKSFVAFIFPSINPYFFSQTIILVIVSIIVGSVIRFPSISLLFSLFTGVILKNTGIMTIELPAWLMIVAYSAIGWNIGLRFNRATLIYAMHVMPIIAGMIMLMIMLAGGIGFVVHIGTGVDPLTAYLATSPGGIDSLAIIAAASGADIGFVMAIQTSRLIIVLMTGPLLAKLATKHAIKKMRHPAGSDTL